MSGDQPAGNNRPLDLDGADLRRLEKALLGLFDSDGLNALGFFALGKSRDEFSNEDASRPEVALDLIVTAREDGLLRELLLETQERAAALRTPKGDELVALCAELLQRPPGVAGALPAARRLAPRDDRQVEAEADLCHPRAQAQDAQTAATTQLMLPFAVTAERAEEICRAWFGSEFVHPRDLKTVAKLATPTGVYLPAWQWSGHAVSTWTAMAVYFERRERTVRTAMPQTATPGAAPPPETTEVEVIRRAPVPVSGDHEGSYPATWVLAFAGPPWLQTAWPTEHGYDFGQVTPYDAQIAAPYRVEPPTIDRQAARRSACETIKEAEKAACREQMPGDEVEDPVVKTRIVSLEDLLIHLPVWRVSYDYKGKSYGCHVNGQSGTAVCHGPTDTARNLFPWLMFLLFILVVAVVGYLISQ